MLRTAPALLALSLALSLALAPASAPAALVTAAFEGVVTENRTDDDPDLYQFTRGERFSLVVQYDSATIPDTDPDPNLGSYAFGPMFDPEPIDRGITAILTTSGGFRREFANGGSERVWLGATDRVLFNAYGTSSFDIMVNFEAPGGTLSSDAMLTAADFLRFSTGTISYSFVGGRDEGFAGTLIAVDGPPVAPVPEPSTLVGLGVGLGVLVLVRARRRRRA